MHRSLLVFLLRFFRALYLTAIMGRGAKRKKQNKANQQKDPQEVQNDQKKNNDNPDMDPQEVKMMRQQTSTNFEKGRGNRFGTKLSKICPQVKLSISLT